MPRAPHIQVELKVIEVHAPMVARACEVPVTHILGGLSLLWHRCWSIKSAQVTNVGLAGIFGPRDLDRLTEAMEEVGFIEKSGDGWRVRGVDKYLRLAAARSKGGHAAKANLVPGGSAKVQSAEPEPRNDPRLNLGSYTEHRTPNTEHPKAKRGPPKKPAASRPSDELLADFKATIGEAYHWQGAKDGVALAALLKAHTLEEIRARWRRGLAATGWASCRTVAQLASKWNDLAGTAPANTRSPVAAESVDWNNAQEGEVAL